MPNHQPVLKLIATVSNMDGASSMATVRDSESEVKSCQMGDLTGTIQPSLWDSQIDRVELGKTYAFTNLSTRSFNGKTNLTTTRNTIILQSSSTITLPNTNTNDLEIQTNTLTEPVEGSTITIKKLCPKCHRPQPSINTKENLHRRNTCKILKQSSYITKCNGSLIFKMEEDEPSLAIPNSVLTKFLKKQKEMTYIDARDIEEYLLTCGPVTDNYTNDNHVIAINKAMCSTELTSDELEQELCSITAAISLTSTSNQSNPGEKGLLHMKTTDAKQTRPPKDSK